MPCSATTPSATNAIQSAVRAVGKRCAIRIVVRLRETRAIAACRATGKYVGICGQGPSDHPDFADWLAAEGIVSMSLNPDTIVETWQRLASAK